MSNPKIESMEETQVQALPVAVPMEMKSESASQESSVSKREVMYIPKILWDERSFDTEHIMKEIKKQPLEVELEREFQNGISVEVSPPIKKGTGLNKFTVYMLTGKDKNGTYSIERRYKHLVLLREKLAIRWPGFLIPPLPNVTKLGKTEEHITSSRNSFLVNFFLKMSVLPHIYYGEEFQTFLKAPDNGVEQLLDAMKQPKLIETLKNYKENCREYIPEVPMEVEEAERTKSWQNIDKFEAYFQKWKGDLYLYKDQLRSLVKAKERYYNAVSRVETVILPDYEQLILKWINGLELDELEIKGGSKETIAVSKQGEPKEKRLEEKTETESKGIETKSVIQDGVYTSPAYKESVLKDSRANWSDSTWQLYDLLRHQLKQIDSILQLILQVKYIRKEEDYLRHSIAQNIDQIQKLNEKKSTLKIFLMGGTEDEKRAKLSEESHRAEEQMKVVLELQEIVRLMLQRTIKQFHEQRIAAYHWSLKRSMHLQMQIAVNVMEAHRQQLQVISRLKQIEE